MRHCQARSRSPNGFTKSVRIRSTVYFVPNQGPELPVTAAGVIALPAHHGDPFDRLLIAQSRIEKLPIVTADRRLKEYGVEVLW